MSGNEWIIEGVTQFIESPMWTQPVQDFIDDHCVVFGEAYANESAASGGISTSLFNNSNEESSSASSGPSKDLSPELYMIHKQFAELIDTVLTGYLEELGVGAEQALEVLRDSPKKEAQSFITYLLSLDDFPTFKTMMVKRNHELELEALRAIERKIERTKAEEEEKRDQMMTGWV